MEFINKLMIGVINNPDFIHGMTFNGVEHIEERFFDGWNYFKTLSPFLIKTYANKTQCLNKIAQLISSGIDCNMSLSHPFTIIKKCKRNNIFSEYTFISGQ